MWVCIRKFVRRSSIRSSPRKAKQDSDSAWQSVSASSDDTAATSKSNRNMEKERSFGSPCRSQRSSRRASTGCTGRELSRRSDTRLRAQYTAKRSLTRLLVVDDEDFVRELLGEILEGEHCDVYLAESGSEALSMFREMSLMVCLLMSACRG